MLSAKLQAHFLHGSPLDTLEAESCMTLCLALPNTKCLTRTTESQCKLLHYFARSTAHCLEAYKGIQVFDDSMVDFRGH